VVTIASPRAGATLAAAGRNLLKGVAIDTEETDIEYRWVLVEGGEEIEIATGSGASGSDAIVYWVPSADMRAGCGGRVVTLKLYATGEDGETGSAQVEVTVLLPPC
jgi:hypothetical protein